MRVFAGGISGRQNTLICMECTGRNNTENGVDT